MQGNSRHQIRLELVQIDVEGAVESKRGRNRRDDLGNKSVQVGEPGRRDIESLLANIVKGFVINLWMGTSAYAVMSWYRVEHSP